MNLYEKLLILDSDLDDKVREEQVEKVKGLILKQGGEILKTENLGRRKLAYEIKKREKGNYILLLFNASPSTITELERYCKLAEPILKYIVIKLKKKKHIAAVMSSLNEKSTKGDAGMPAQERVSESIPKRRDDVTTGENMTTQDVKS